MKLQMGVGTKGGARTAATSERDANVACTWSPLGRSRAWPVQTAGADRVCQVIKFRPQDKC